MPLIKRGNTWHVHFFTPDGKRIRQSTGTVDRKEAQEYHDRLKASIWRTEQLGDKPERTWKEAVVKFLGETEYKASRKDDLSRLRWLNKYLGKMKLSEITRDGLIQIAEKKRCEASASTANRHMEIVRTILRKAEREWEWIEKAVAVKMFREPKIRIRWLTKEEAQKLISELPDHLAPMVKFSLATGLRQSNVTGLEWSQIDMERKTAWVHPDQMKTRRAISVPLNDVALHVLLEQEGKNSKFVFSYKGRRIKWANTKAWRSALKRAKIENFRWHDLRHTWASWHVQAGTPLHVLQELGGWESAEMVRRYAHLGGQHLAEYATIISWANDTNTTQSENGPRMLRII